MVDEAKAPATSLSEQPAAPADAAGPSEQAVQAQQAPVTETPKPQQPPPPAEQDWEAKLREARERGRREALSELGKREAEARRLEREAARKAKEAIIQQVSAYVPEDQIAAVQQTIQHQDVLAELEQWRAWAAEQQRQEALRQQAARYMRMVEEAGLKWDDIPAEVKGEGPDPEFPERFALHVAKLVAKEKKEAEARERKAREEAAKETERQLGVTRVGGAAPTGAAASNLQSLVQKLREAHRRNDAAAIEELGRRIEEEVYRAR